MGDHAQIGSATVKVRELVESTEMWLKLHFQPKNQVLKIEGAQLFLSSYFSTKGHAYAGKSFKTTIPSVDHRQHAVNAKLQEKYMAEQRTKFATLRRKNETMMRQMGGNIESLNLGEGVNQEQRTMRSWALNPKYLEKVQTAAGHDHGLAAPQSAGRVSHLSSKVITGHEHHADGKISHLYQPELTPWRNKADPRHASPAKSAVSQASPSGIDKYTKKPEYIVDEKQLQFKNSTAMRNRNKVNQPAPLAGSRAAFPFHKESESSPGGSPPVKYALGTNQEQVNIVL